MEEEQKPILARIILEIVGAPKDHVEKVLKLVMDKIEKEQGVKIINGEVFEAKEIKDKLFSSFAEAELELESTNKLLDFCFDYMPSSIEILSPTKLSLGAENLGNILNDMLAKLHKYDLVLKNIHAENILLKREKEQANKNK